MSEITKQVKVTIILHKQRPLMDGSFPIRLRLTYQKRRKYFSLPHTPSENMYATEEDWEKIQSLKPRGKHKEIKLKMGIYEKKALDILDEMERNGASFTFDRFKSRFFGSTQTNTVFNLFEQVIQERRDRGRIGTATSYNNAFVKLKKYRKYRDMYFADIDEKFLTKWQDDMLENGTSINTVGFYMRSLRTVYNQAIKRGYARLQEYPFRDYKIPATQKAKRALSKEDILRIHRYETDPNSTEGQSKAYFMFSYLMQGMNFIDIAHLKNKDIADGRISYYRHKTARSRGDLKLLSIKITPQIEALLEQLRVESRSPLDYVFPILEKGMSPTRQKATVRDFILQTNNHLKNIGEDLELPIKLTTYVARHSYATILRRSGVSTPVISELLAHSSEKTTQTYLGSFEQDVYDKVNELLL